MTMHNYGNTQKKVTFGGISCEEYVLLHLLVGLMPLPDMVKNMMEYHELVCFTHGSDEFKSLVPRRPISMSVRKEAMDLVEKLTRVG